jgi:integrase
VVRVKIFQKNQGVGNPTLKKLGITTLINFKDTRASFITNAMDNNERMSYIQKQVGHTTTRMVVDHYYRHVPAPMMGPNLKTLGILPGFYQSKAAMNCK